MAPERGAPAPRFFRRAVLGLLAAAGLLAGCGGSGSRPGAARPATAAALFTQACGACHSLDGRSSPSRQGGDLLGYPYGRAALLQFAREMPVRRRLDARELASVVDYVAGAERAGRAPDLHAFRRGDGAHQRG